MSFPPLSSLVAWAALVVALPPAQAQTQPPAPAPAPAQSTAAALLSTVHLQGRTEADSPFNLSNWRGKVVLIYAWNSRCAVCISHMPELRANRNGWAGQAFDIVSINTDPEATDITQWHRLQQQTIAPAQRWPSLWTGSSGFSSNLPLAGQLPAVWVLDKTGAVKFHVRGRVPTEVWNQIADLL